MWSPGAAAQEQGDERERIEAVIEAIVVTGSRIDLTGMTTATPVTVVTDEDLELFGSGTLMDSLQYMPQLQMNTRVEGVRADTWRSTAGQSAVNMRGVGRSRTLVLIDGRRVVPSNNLGFVDINQIPRALMRRVEIVTGGASAAYGSDAVAGVINFILDTDYTGFSAGVETGTSYVQDADNLQIELATGFEVGERSHVVLAGDYYTVDGVPNYFGRDWYRNRGDLNRGDPEDTGILPQRVRVEHLCSRNYTFGGLITEGPLAGTQFLTDGTPAPFPDHLPMDRRAETGLESGIIRGVHVDPTCDDLRLHGRVRSAEERRSLFGRWTYDLNDDTELSLQGIYGYNKVTSQRGRYTFSSDLERITIFPDNAFLPEEIRQRMLDPDDPIESFVLSKEIPQSDPMNNAGEGAPVTGQTVSWTAAIDGTLSNDWRYTAYYQYGRSNRYLEAHGYRHDRLWRGLDAVVHPDTGEIVCRSTLVMPDDGCVPINFFGLGNETQAARDYVHGYMWSDSTVKQHAGEFLVNGKLHDGWGSGPIFGAMGVSARKESIVQVGGDPLDGALMEAPPMVNGQPLYLGFPDGLIGSSVINRADAPTFEGDYSVWEVFAETLFPIVQGRSWARDMTLNLAARYADYSGSGGMWAWKAGLDWQIVEDLRFRMTRSRDIRAANLNERFNTTLETTGVEDPFREDARDVVNVISGGNPEVEPEASDTITLGLVYQPSWLEGLSTSIDWYDIDIANAITFVGVGRIIDSCFDLGAFCDQIERGPPEPGETIGPITTVRDQYLNVEHFRARGTDLEVSYRPSFRPLDGHVRTRLLVTHVDETSFDRPGGISVRFAGTPFMPEWSGTLSLIWVRGPLVLSWSERFRDGVVRDLEWVEGVDADVNELDFQHVSNLRATYDFDVGKGVLSLRAAVQNVFNRNPGDVNGQSNIYRDVGRSYTLGLRYEFGDGERRRRPRRR